MNIKGQRVAKGIVGIRKFYNEQINNSGWHVMTDKDGYVEYREDSAYVLIHEFNTMGYTFAGFTGNGLYFIEDLESVEGERTV